MSVLEAIENDIKQLPRSAALELQEWLADYLDDQECLSPDFVTSIKRGKREFTHTKSVIEPKSASKRRR